MKKVLLITLTITLFNCKNMDQKLMYNTSDFSKFEEKSTLKWEDAIKIYEANFQNKFDVNVNILKDQNFRKNYDRFIYVTDNNYNIGFASLNDKRGIESVPLKYLAKINSETGEISIRNYQEKD